MSTLDREPRISGGKSTPLHEPRIDSGVNTAKPPRANMAPKLAPKPPLPRTK